jgi:hypothetical protein
MIARRGLYVSVAETLFAASVLRLLTPVAVQYELRQTAIIKGIA